MKGRREGKVMMKEQSKGKKRVYEKGKEVKEGGGDRTRGEERKERLNEMTKMK